MAKGIDDSFEPNPEAELVRGRHAIVWTVNADLNGKPYKTPRYREGFKAETEHRPVHRERPPHEGRRIELGRCLESARQLADAAANNNAAA